MKMLSETLVIIQIRDQLQESLARAESLSPSGWRNKRVFAEVRVVADGVSGAPAKKEFTLPSQEEEEDVAWLIEKHTEEPLQIAKASQVSRLIQTQTRRLQKELDLEALLQTSENGGRLIILEVFYGKHVQTLHWELLESAALWPPGWQLMVRRSVPGPGPMESYIPPIKKTSQDTLRILLVVARKCNKFNSVATIKMNNDGRKVDIDHRLNSLRLFQLKEAFPPDSLRIDIARPGTPSAFKEYLSKHKYDVVHFDLHGQVTEEGAQLLFIESNGDGTQWVDVEDIAKELCKRAVPLVVLNACKSAVIGGLQSTSNLAATFVSRGVPAAIGMSYDISEDAVRIFQSAFYPTLFHSGLDPAIALSEARAALEADDFRSSRLPGYGVHTRDFFVPKLHQRQVLWLGGNTSAVTACTNLTTSAYQSEILPTSFIGRDREIFEVERHMHFRSNIGLVFGSLGVGKKYLLEHLGWWWELTDMVDGTISVELRDQTASLAVVLQSVTKEIQSLQSGQSAEEEDASAELTETVVQYLSTHRVLLLIQGLLSVPRWLLDFVRKLKGSKCLVLISCRNSQLPLMAETDSISSWAFRCQLGGLRPEHALIMLKGSIAKVGKSTPRGESRKRSRPWFEERIVRLLQCHPLAIEAVRVATCGRVSPSTYSTLLSGILPINWNDPKFQELRSDFEKLCQIYKHSTSCFAPFASRVPRDVWFEILRKTFPDTTENVTMLEQMLTELGFAKFSVNQQTHFQVHPLLIPFIRSSVDTQRLIGRIWENTTIYYHNRSLQSIDRGIFSETTFQDITLHWEHILGSLHYLVDKGLENPGNTCFDLSWILCILVASSYAWKESEKRCQESLCVEDVFANLTAKAFQQLFPQFRPFGNQVWQRLHEIHVRARARRFSEVQIIRAICFCHILITFFYDNSVETALAYNEVLRWILDDTDISGSKNNVEALRRLCKCIYMLSYEDICLEIGPKSLAPLKQYLELHDSFQSLNLVENEKDYISVWMDTIVCRGLFDYLPTFVVTLENVAALIRVGKPRTIEIPTYKHQKLDLPEHEQDSMVAPLEDMTEASRALNGSEADLKEGLSRLNKHLEAAINAKDPRRQLEIFEKLFQIHVNRLNDAHSGLFFIDKIEQCWDQMHQLPGFKTDDIAWLDIQIWMAQCRAELLKDIDDRESSNREVDKLRHLVKERESRWTKLDRESEGLRNMQATAAYAVATSQQGGGPKEFGGHVFRQKIYEGSPWIMNTNVAEESRESNARDVEPSPRGLEEEGAAISFSQPNETEAVGEDVSDVANPAFASVSKELERLSVKHRSVGSTVQAPPGHYASLFLRQGRHLIIQRVIRILHPSQAATAS